MQIAKLNATPEAAPTGVVRLTFADKVQVDLDLKDLFETPDDYLALPLIPRCLMVHGLKQKCPDAYSKTSGPMNARSALQKVWDTLRGADGQPGTWTVKRAPAAVKETKVELVAKAYVAAMAKLDPPIERDFDSVLANLKVKTPKQRQAIAEVEQIALELNKLIENKTPLENVSL
jgi:hypothetical protein